MLQAHISTVVFQAIARDEPLAQQVTSRIESMMNDGRLAPGDRLSSERELARSFGVSRTVIREALRTLVAKGLLEPLGSGGAVVRRPSLEALAQSLRMFLRDSEGRLDHANLQQLQQLITLEAARLADEQ
jgi:GntR family transcriptional repressor for pyruvate dehydrogenase complex